MKQKIADVIIEICKIRFEIENREFAKNEENKIRNIIKEEERNFKSDMESNMYDIVEINEFIEYILNNILNKKKQLEFYFESGNEMDKHFYNGRCKTNKKQINVSILNKSLGIDSHIKTRLFNKKNEQDKIINKYMNEILDQKNKKDKLREILYSYPKNLSIN